MLPRDALAQSTTVSRSLQFSSLPVALQQWLATRQLTATNFESYLNQLRAQTATRERDGEFEHLLYFALQSTRFTTQAKIEPALSAYEFVQSLPPTVQAAYLKEDDFVPTPLTLPVSVTARLQAFLQALKKSPLDERQAYFQQFLAQNVRREEASLERLRREYARVMKFLYRKEFLARKLSQPEQLSEYVATLYQTRGHSTDTQIEANFTVYEAMAALKAQAPNARLSNVLIVGPGLDFAPRTDLLDAFEPQCYQPFAVADALLSLGLTTLPPLRIHCVDINQRVVAHLQRLPARREISLALLSGIAEKPERPFAENYQRYFQMLGQKIGSESDLDVPAAWRAHLRKRLTVRVDVAHAITAESLNIITDSLVPVARYDLVIVTNVFPYFNDTELALALANIAAGLKPGGYLLHNDARRELLGFASLLQLPSVQARTVLLAGQGANALFDGVVIHQKKAL
ncbi:MAG: hypothetical protein U0Y68_20390 [Blastocatellia bacterium]